MKKAPRRSRKRRECRQIHPRHCVPETKCGDAETHNTSTDCLRYDGRDRSFPRGDSGARELCSQSASPHDGLRDRSAIHVVFFAHKAFDCSQAHSYGVHFQSDSTLPTSIRSTFHTMVNTWRAAARPLMLLKRRSCQQAELESKTSDLSNPIQTPRLSRPAFLELRTLEVL